MAVCSINMNLHHTQRGKDMPTIEDFTQDNGESIKKAVAENEAKKRIRGKIIKVSDEGWGFISSLDLKFTRIFFHWTSLKQDTLKFTELHNGMQVEFEPVEVEGKGWRAIRIVVIPEEKKENGETPVP